MSTFAWTQLEARVSALERRQIKTDARIEEVARDATIGVKQRPEDMTASFGQLSAYMGTIEEKNEKRFQTIEGSLSEHTRILGEHSQRLDNIETTLGDHTKRLGNIETLLTQILARLPENR